MKSHTEVKERSLPPSVGGVYCLNTSQELFFTRSSAQRMLEVHMKVSYEDAVSVPSQVLESFEVFMWTETTAYALFRSKLSPSNNLMSEVNSKSGGYMPLRGSSICHHGD